jgi:hypothetical protein
MRSSILILVCCSLPPILLATEDIRIVPNSVNRKVQSNKLLKAKRADAFKQFQLKHAQVPQRTTQRECDEQGNCIKPGLLGLLRETRGLELCAGCGFVRDHGLFGVLSAAFLLDLT